MMVVAFSVHPRYSGAPKLSDLLMRYGMLAPMLSSLSGWSDDDTSYSVHLHAINMDPFTSKVVDPSCLVGGKRGEEDAVEGMNSWLAHFMRNVIGPSYSMVDPDSGGYEDHEYNTPTIWVDKLKSIGFTQSN